ncbi:MAG: ribosome-associated translation inhibitor RaiA [Gammaproteobacteria bacterium]|nr:ribosome-associated translation inhibitor RaiA [Gammaproteobacteria bacterium]MCW5582865.1 ribosome-associated translation inhibitor RaiA [Gammaproteobacteria bacterium]
MLPVQITIRDISSSAALETHIRKKAEKLNRFYNRISSCRVVVELPQKHKHQGKLYNVRIDVTVPGKELVATRKVNQDIYIAVRDSFSAIVRQLEEHSHKRHGRVKTHNDVMHGHVVRIISDEGYGFIEGVDGNEYYFSVTNVSHPNFDQLYVGDAVEYYIADALSEGRQAQHVIKERHNNHHPEFI